MKKWVSLLLAAVMLCVICGSTLAEDAGLPELEVLCYTNALTKNVEELPYLAAMAEKAGVKLKLEQITSGWDEIKSTLLASGDLPDIILGGSAILSSDIAQFPNLFADLKDLIASDGPNVQKMFAEHPELGYLCTDENGSVFALPKYQRYQPESVTRQMINKTWLDNLGLAVPTTWDELYDVLLAFKTKDPNQNGEADEIPIDFAAGPASAIWGDLPTILAYLCGFGIPVTTMEQEGWYLKNGEVKSVWTSEEYKQFVGFLRKCWEAELINVEVFTQDHSSMQALGRTGKVGVTLGWDITDRIGVEFADQYITFAPVLPDPSYDETAVWEYSSYALNYGYPMMVLSSACENKEAAMRFMDLFYDPYYGMQALFGSIGDCIKDNGDGTYAVLPPADETIDPGTWKWMNAIADSSPMYISDELQLDLPSDLKAMNALNEPFAKYVARVGLDGWPGPFLKYTDEQSTDLAFLMTELNNLYLNKFAEWVVYGGIDEQWDAYLKDVENAGFKDAQTIVQNAVDSYLAYVK